MNILGSRKIRGCFRSAKYMYLWEDRSRAKTQGLSWRALVLVADWAVTGGRDEVEPHIACLLKAVVLLFTLYTHEKAEHNRKQFLEILFLMVSFGLLISDLRRKSVTILILCFLFEERCYWWWTGCASRELKLVLVLRNQTNVSFFAFFFFFHRKFSFYLYLHAHFNA